MHDRCMTTVMRVQRDGTVLDAAAPAGLSMRRANGERRYLLLLSHMRSYSSLLAHLLGSSPEIDGYGETLLRYRHALDLWRLRREIRRSTGHPLRGRWLLDKVLHNTIRPLDRLVDGARIDVLIFVRKPESTLRSLLSLAARKGPSEGFNSPEVCCDYYIERLHRLRADGERYGERALYFDAEVLIERPQAVLGAVAPWLGLTAPLSTRYQVGARSGEEGFGDWSENIRAGQVLGPEHSTVQTATALPPAILAEAEAAYRRCRAALLQSCTPVHAALLAP